MYLFRSLSNKVVAHEHLKNGNGNADIKVHVFVSKLNVAARYNNFISKLSYNSPAIRMIVDELRAVTQPCKSSPANAQWSIRILQSSLLIRD